MNALDLFRYNDTEVRVDNSIVKGAESHLYVIELAGLGVKVGITADPVTRLRTHAHLARSHGSEVLRVCLTPPHETARANERHIVSTFSPGRRTEYLSCSFDEALREVRKCEFPRADAKAFEDRNKSVSDFFKAFVMGAGR